MWIHVLILSVLAAQCEGNLSQFYQMISRLGEVEPTSLLNYGCFCGWGNSGRTKVIDCLDKCCYHHDNCYAQLSAQCRGTSYLFTSYSVDRETMTCDPDQDRCKLMLCKCDHDFGVCVGHNKGWEKPECKNVKDTDVCRPGENYTMPECNTSDTIPEDLYHDACQCRELQSPPSGENEETTLSPRSNNTQTTEQPHSRSVQTTQTKPKTTKLSDIKPPESQKLLNNESSQLNLSKLNELLAASLLIVLLAPVLLA